MKKNCILLLILSSLLLFSCKKENRSDCIKGTGTMIVEHRESLPFDSIEVYNNITLYLRYDTVPSIVVEAGENLVPLIETSVVNNKLTIQNNNKCNFMRSYDYPVNVTVSIQELQYLNLAGSGNIYSLNQLKMKRVRMVNSGIGDMELDINAGHLFTQIYGSGGIHLSGKAAVSEIYSTGNCFMYCEGLITGYTFLHSNTTGHIYIHAEKELGVTILGSGDVFYSGDPVLKNIKISGKGELKKL